MLYICLIIGHSRGTATAGYGVHTTSYGGGEEFKKARGMLAGRSIAAAKTWRALASGMTGNFDARGQHNILYVTRTMQRHLSAFLHLSASR
jgi:hypothetical protein